MKEYQKKKNNPYLLPKNLYMQIKYAVRDYDRMRDRYREILLESPPPPDGLPKGNGLHSPTEDKVLRRAAIMEWLEAIDEALFLVPPEYRKGVFREAQDRGGFPLDAARSCYQKWKQRFFYQIAENRRLL